MEWWLEEPWVFALWSIEELRDEDRRTRWRERMERLELAQLISQGINDPPRLAEERRAILATAGTARPVDRGTLLERGERIARFVRKGKVLLS